MRCWGARGDGAIGDGLTGSTWTTPKTVQLPSSVKATAIAAGKLHTCAVGGGKVWCWGTNNAGQVGQSTAGKTFPSPTEVKNLPEVVTDIAAGDMHTCVALKSGAAMCFGGNNYRQLGTYVPSGAVVKPGYVVNGPADSKLTKVGAVLAGGRSSCAVVGLQSGVGALSCWGENNYSQLALGYGGDLICDPKCVDKACGEGCNDAIRCGGCGAGSTCDDAAGQCKACKGSCTGRECGSDGCDGWCGSCPSGNKCTKNGKCVPTFGCGGQCTNTWLTKDGSLCSCASKCGANGQPPCCADQGKTCGP